MLRSRIDSIFEALSSDQDLDNKAKSDLADTAFQIAGLIGDNCSQALARIKQALPLTQMGSADSALAHLYWANNALAPDCDSATRMGLFVNLTMVYLPLGDMQSIDSVGRLALRYWNPQWADKKLRWMVISNMAISQVYRQRPDSANALFHLVYREAGASHDSTYILKSFTNLGALKGMTGDFDSAYYFLNSAALIMNKNVDAYDYMNLLINIANVEGERGRIRDAEERLDSAYRMAVSLKSNEMVAAAQNARADLYAQTHRFEDAYHFLRDYTDTREKYLDDARVKAIADMQEKYESEKKARQIKQLEVKQLGSELENERITKARNRLMYAGIVILLVAGGLWSRLRYVRKSRAAIQKEKDVSEGLLLNILPGSVADELKAKGYTDAKHFENATILFSDFSGFTQISEQLSASELVDELNACFKQFDEITTKYGIEKIKTIGDSYMSAGGLPDTNRATTADVVRAAIEMQQFATERAMHREAEGLPGFRMRLGIHSGPVIAGIVGVKKFQYDIWGDTVNTASRMETSGEIGRVNISGDTYQLLKDDPSFKFTPRGKVTTKGKGDMEMYFVELA